MIELLLVAGVILAIVFGRKGIKLSGLGGSSFSGVNKLRPLLVIGVGGAILLFGGSFLSWLFQTDWNSTEAGRVLSDEFGSWAGNIVPAIVIITIIGVILFVVSEPMRASIAKRGDMVFGLVLVVGALVAFMNVTTNMRNDERTCPEVPPLIDVSTRGTLVEVFQCWDAVFVILPGGSDNLRLNFAETGALYRSRSPHQVIRIDYEFPGKIVGAVRLMPVDEAFREMNLNSLELVVTAY